MISFFAHLCLIFLLISSFTESILHQPEEHAKYFQLNLLTKKKVFIPNGMLLFLFQSKRLHLETLKESVSLQCSSSLIYAEHRHLL